MRLWRVTALGLAALALVLAAIFPDGLLLFGATPERGVRLGRMLFFWIGVALVLATTWGRGT
jgi:hypothetical protein